MSYLLVIEDDSDTRALISIALRKERFAITAVGSAAAGLKHLEANESPSLIFLDLTLPDMSGDEFMRILRSNERFAALNVMICSGWDNLQARAKSIGANDWLPKPFEISALGDKLRPYFA